MGRVTRLTPRMSRVTLTGPELEGLVVPEPAASVRLLVPSPAGARELVMPAWTGNEYLLPSGERPALRTFTPLHVDTENLVLDIDIVIHGTGPVSEWAAAAEVGDEAAVSGPARGYTVDMQAPAYLLAGDETAIPAITQLLRVIPDSTPVQVHIEIAVPEARLPLPEHPRAAVEWHVAADGALPGDALAAAVIGADFGADTRVWVAGEAAAVQRVRRFLFDERNMPRTQTAVRGYWKHGRSGELTE